MCDQDHFDDDLKDYVARGAVTRREFGALSLGAGMSFLLPRVANALAVTEADVTIKTPTASPTRISFIPPAARTPVC